MDGISCCVQTNSWSQTADPHMSTGSMSCGVCMQVAMVTDSRTLHHYWSHSDVTPWSADGRLMLSQRADVGGVQDMLEGFRPHLVQEIGYTNITAGSLLLSCAKA